MSTYFKTKRSYFEFISEGIGEDLINPDQEAVGGCVLGREEFIEDIKEKYLSKEKRQEDLPSLKEIRKKSISEELIEKLVDREEKLSQKEKNKLIIYFLRKFTDKALWDISEKYFKGQSVSGVNKIASNSSAILKLRRYWSLRAKRSNLAFEIASLRYRSSQ